MLDTPAVFLFEFGIIGLLASLEIGRRWRRGDWTTPQLQAAGFIVAVLLLTVFVRPPAGQPNNLYARPLLLVWFLSAPFAASAFLRMGSDRRTYRLLTTATAVCFLGTAYATIGATLEGLLFWSSDTNRVDAVRWLNHNSQPGTVVGIHPEELDSNFGYWLRRPLALGSKRHALLFGAEETDYDDYRQRLASAFAARSSPQAAELFDRLSVEALVVRLQRPSGSSGVPSAETATTGFQTADGLPIWARPPCFRAGYRNRSWAVLLRQSKRCRDGTDS